MKESIYYFDFSIKRYGYKFNFDESLYRYFLRQPKSTLMQSGWKSNFYNMFLNEKKDVPILMDVISKARGFFGDDKHITALSLIRFVQGGLEYDYEKIKNDDWDMYYPYETLYHGKGVCSDKSILLAKLLILLGFRVVLFSHAKERHMTLGIQVPNGQGTFNLPEGSFAIIESTTYIQLGIIPPNSDLSKDDLTVIYPQTNGSMVFTRILELRQNEQEAIMKYGKEYIHANAYQKNILIKMKEINDEMQKINTMLNRTSDAATSNSLIKRYNKYVSDINLLGAYFNQANNM